MPYSIVDRLLDVADDGKRWSPTSGLPAANGSGSGSGSGSSNSSSTSPHHQQQRDRERRKLPSSSSSSSSAPSKYEEKQRIALENFLRDSWLCVMKPQYRKWVTEMDGLDKLQMADEELPTPGDGEVLVKIHAVSVNYRDIEVCSGEYDHHPSLVEKRTIVPCSDMCGTVLDSRFERLKQGTRVMAIFNQSHLHGDIKEEDMGSGLGLPLPGVLAEYRCFPAESLVVVPNYLSNEEAACLPIASVTAWTAMNWLRPVGHALGTDKHAHEAKKSILLQGTGGVAVAGAQIAKAAGLRTIITSLSDDKLARAKDELQVDEGINYRTHWEWQDAVLEATGGKGADIIFETGGARTLRKSFGCVAFGGMISCIGYLSGKNDNGDDEGDGGDGKTPQLHRLNVNVLALRRNVTLKGIINGSRERFEEMVQFYDKHQIKPVVCKTFAFDQAKEALEYVKKGSHFGKVVIRVGEEEK